MMKKRILTVVLGCVIAVSATACGGKAGDSAEVVELPAIGEEDGLSDGDAQGQDDAGGQTFSDRQQTDAEDSDAGGIDAGGTDTGEQASDGRQTDAGGDSQQSQAGDEKSKDDELEEKLAAFRRDRDDSVIDLGNGVTMGGSKNPEDYGFSIDMSAVKRFDTRELTEGYETGKSYVENTLGFVPETRNTVYTCADPRIWAIYDAEDKGVANGYAPENIFICEYCDHGTWQYLILVREGKGSAWEVIHHGSSYRAEEDEN